MKKFPRRRSLFVWGLALGTVAPLALALTPTEWAHRQAVTVAAPGLVKLAVPAATFDAAQPDLADVRIVDAAGQEIPYLLDRDDSSQGQSTSGKINRVRPQSFRAEADTGVSTLTLATGLTQPLDAVELETSAPFFLKAAHVEISVDGVAWQSLGPAIPVFRQFGAEQLQLPLYRQAAGFVRITLDDSRSRPIVFTGARVRSAPTQPSPPALAAVGSRVERREEFTGETVLTVTLAGRQVPLAELHLEVQDPLFMRRVTISVREIQGGVSRERMIGHGTIYRVALDGSSPRTQLDVPVNFPPPAREVLVHIHNGDSPPLTLGAVEARLHPVTLVFMAPATGSFTLLTGNPQALAPHYDLAVFAEEMRTAAAATVMPGALEPVPNYHPREPLADAGLAEIALTGAPLDTRAWSSHRTVHLARTGVQELELDPAALAAARPDFSDLRLLREGNQIPYVLEQPNLARSLDLAPIATPDARRPSVSVWRLPLHEAGLPIQRLVLASPTALFQRHFRIYEIRNDPESGARETVLADAEWSRTPEPGLPASRIFELNETPRTNELWIETDNGDNPPVALAAVQVVYPVVRLVFQAAATDGLMLASGNQAAGAPRYDLSLVAVQLLTASRNVATVAAAETVAAHSFADLFSGPRSGLIFWAALALVVIVLLLVVARLLPKPPAV